MKKTFTLLLLLSIIFTGCSHRITDFTIISTKNVDLSKASTFTRGKTRNEGVDKAHIILWIPFGRPNLKEAIDKSIEMTPGAVALVDGVVYSKAWWAILYGQTKVIVEGTPLIDPSLATTFEMPKYSIATLDKNGNIEEYRAIEEEEYLEMRSEIVKNTKSLEFQNTFELE